MAEIISTINAGNDKNFEFKTKKKGDSFSVIQKDPNKIVMTRTIIPNKREVEQKDIDRFINRTKGNIDKKETKPVKDSNNVEKKKRGRKPKNIESA